VSLSAPISVIIPAHNAEAFLAEAINSVHAQTLAVSEIIVVADDCSDKTKEIASSLGARVFEQNRRNMSAGLNLGIQVSKQPWIALLDADDYWAPNKIALQWQAIASFPEAGLVSCDGYTVYPHVTAAAPRKQLRERWLPVETLVRKKDFYYIEQVDGGFLLRVFIATPSAIVRRDVFAQVGLFDESLLYGQTLEFFARVLARYPVAFVQKPLFHIRVHDHNHTRGLRGWPSQVSIVDRMLKNPSRYAKGAGQAHREYIKRNFATAERILMLNQRGET